MGEAVAGHGVFQEDGVAVLARDARADLALASW